MRASWLEGGAPITADALRREGIACEGCRVEPAAYRPLLDRYRSERGYVAEDEVALGPETPGLEAICDRFKDEHQHDDDEVRFVLAGEGTFDIRSGAGRWMRVEVEPGDLIIVPRGRWHRFFLTERKAIRCVRLFQDASGWVPRYRERERPGTAAGPA